MTAPAPTTYGFVTKTFHWLTALGIIALFPLGVIANRLPYDTPEQLAQKAQLFSIHKTLGVLVFFVAVLRILWALGQRKPGPLHPEKRIETWAAETVHWVLYGSLVIVPLSGWVHHAATTGFAPIWWPFGQTLPFVPVDNGVAGFFGALHWVSTKVLLVALLLHIAGALKHQIIDRDATLRRMWFGLSDAPAMPAHRTPLSAPLVAAGIFAATVGLAATGGSHEPVAEVAELKAVASDWTVESGAINFTVAQFGSPVEGNIAEWTAAITFDPDAGPDFGDVSVEMAIGSVTVGSVTAQALGPDYFAADAFPVATFTGPITASGEGYEVAGALTLKGVTVPATLLFDLTLDGDTAEMTGTAELDRRDFGIGADGGEAELGFGVPVTVTLVATR